MLSWASSHNNKLYDLKKTFGACRRFFSDVLLLQQGCIYTENYNYSVIVENNPNLLRFQKIKKER